MRVLSIVHQLDAGAGVFGKALRDSGVEIDQWLVSEGGDPPSDPFGYDGVMVFGGAMHVDQEGANPWLRGEKELLRELLERRTPLLGVCLGHQLVAEAAGARPRPAAEPEIGWLEVELTDAGRSDPLLGALPERFEAFQWHSYEAPPPPDARVLARSPVCLQAFRLDGAPVWGIQFHPEVARADLESWLDDYRSDEDAVRIGLDPERLREESAVRIGAWNELGRGIARRFFEQAAGYSGVT
jgi:GMP synthase-like glutamine amidotransferase